MEEREGEEEEEEEEEDRAEDNCHNHVTEEGKKYVGGKDGIRRRRSGKNTVLGSFDRPAN